MIWKSRHKTSWGGQAGRRAFETLRQKWGEVPISSQERAHSVDLLRLPDSELLEVFDASLTEQTTGENFAIRGWYHELYARQFRGQRMLDVGSGLGFDAIAFARAGVNVTCVDVVRENLTVVKRLADGLGLTTIETTLLQDFTSIDSLGQHDVIWANGSLHHAPADVVTAECQSLLRHLRPGGRWIQLAYPKARWEREGRLPFDQWGEKTDGAGTPWAEWKDLEAVLGQLSPVKFRILLALNFHDDDFNWFDLQRVG